jgi:5'-nucleotidase
MKRIAIDMDGVLADVFVQFANWHEKDSGILKKREEVLGLGELQAFPDAKKHVYSKGFFRTVPVIEGSQQMVKKLNDLYEVFIVSAATEFPQSLEEKHAWLQDHFPFIRWQQMVFCGSKTIIQADIMIDDHFKNLDYFEGQTILFDQPHNHLTDAGKHTRVFSWEEIGKLLIN